jgi:glutamate-1-semialdehyde 2,1-aminomutase
LNDAALERLLASEQARFVANHPGSGLLAARANAHFVDGVPMHWMADWGTPHPLFVHHAGGAELVDVDRLRYADFCLGDTGAMFGHSPPPIAAAIQRQAGRGLTSMLPDADLAEVGERLAALFGLPSWQITLSATDANRAMLRWARAVTGRPRVLLFDGCYHGTVDETMVRRGADDAAVARAGLIGAPFDLATGARVVPFNDLPALAAALAHGDIAALLCEPVMTNIGMVLPQAGFLQGAFALARQHGALVILDETHTLSSGLGGYGRTHQLDIDALVCGKAIAGGVPCAVYGFSDTLHARITRFKATRSPGHSGMGTTLAASPLATAALLAALRELITADNYRIMETRALLLANALQALFAQRQLDWHVSRVGARTEFGFGPAPRDATESERRMRPLLERVIHLGMLNRGYLLTPFHNMLLTSPATTIADINGLVGALGSVLEDIRA